MKTIFFLITICCLTNINADLFEIPRTIIQGIPGVGKTVMKLLTDVLSFPIKLAEGIYDNAATITDVIFNHTIFPIIPDTRRVIPKLAKILKNFPIVPGGVVSEVTLNDSIHSVEKFDIFYYQCVIERINDFREKYYIRGTHWCGNGDIAHDEDDTGIAVSVDICCREHDHCGDAINAGETRHGLTNTAAYTRSHCNCDVKFFNCLKATFTPLAIATGLVYFSLLGPQCFKEAYPIVGCNLKLFNRCIAYEVDDTQERKYQWFDNPFFG